MQFFCFFQTVFYVIIDFEVRNLKREFTFSEARINEMLLKNVKENRDIEKISTEIHVGFFIIKLHTNFPTNPIICAPLVPEKIWDDGKTYKLMLKKKSRMYVDGMDEGALGQSLSGDKLDSFAELKMNETDFISANGDEITLKIEKSSELGMYADLAPELVAKAIASSKLICEEKVLIVETEVSEWDIKAAILKNPGAIGNIFANGINGIKDKNRME